MVFGLYQDEYGFESEVPGSLPVYLHPDGSAAANEIVTVDEYHTNRFGVPMEFTAMFFYRFGGKWMTFGNGVNGATLPLYSPDGTYVMGMVGVKPDGELIGIFNAETGDALNGAYSPAVPMGPGGTYISMLFVLKKGVPQTGKYKVLGSSFEIDPEYGIEIIA